LSLSYQTEQVPVVQYGTKTVTIQTNIYSTIYVSNYKIYETVVRRYITKIVSRYISPDGIEVTGLRYPQTTLNQSMFQGGRLSLLECNRFRFHPASGLGAQPRSG